MSVIEQHREDWEELAQLDPMWAILTSPENRFGRWDTDAFFATGEEEVATLLRRVDELGGLGGTGSALDFGCGVGRVSRAFASRFDRVVGVDISATMLDRGRELNEGVGNLEFVHNVTEDLAVLEDERFDLIYSRIVLQHLPSREIAHGYISEFARLLAPGGRLVFQVPMYVPRRYRLLVVRRAYTALRALGVPPETLYKRLHLHPISMLFVPEDILRTWLTGLRLDAIDHATYENVVSGTVYATRPASAT